MKKNKKEMKIFINFELKGDIEVDEKFTEKIFSNGIYNDKDYKEIRKIIAKSILSGESGFFLNGFSYKNKED